MYIFQDVYRHEVHLSFTCYPFSKTPKHVWVVCLYKDKWLLTDHTFRGLEFPGGKVEEGESPETAAIREVKEETGGLVSNIEYIGQYKVVGRGRTIIKNIYFAQIDKLEPQASYFETNGPVLLKNLPGKIADNHRFSFIMKDDVLQYSLKEVEKHLDKIR